MTQKTNQHKLQHRKSQTSNTNDTKHSPNKQKNKNSAKITSKQTVITPSVICYIYFTRLKEHLLAHDISPCKTKPYMYKERTITSPTIISVTIDDDFIVSTEHQDDIQCIS